MGRAPCCDKANVKKGPWSPEEDAKLKEYIEKYGTGGNWIALPQKVGLKRCGKSCRLRWLNYLRPNIKHGDFSEDEDRIICSLYASIGSRWSIIAAQLPGRTDNDIKNYWNTKLKKLMGMAASSQQRKSTSLPMIPSSPSPLSSLSSLYRDSYSTSYYTPSKPFGQGQFEPNLFPSSLLMNNNNISSATNNLSLFDQAQAESYAGPIMQYYNPASLNKDNNNMLIFGSSDQQASCSSNSDNGSCSQISYNGKEIKQEDHQMGFQNYNNNNNNNIPINGFDHHHQHEVVNHKFMLTSDYGSGNNNASSGCDVMINQWTDHDQKPNNGYANFVNNNNAAISSTPPPLDYDLEHVKQLICSSNGGGGDDSLMIFSSDDNKTQEKEVLYYYY